MKIAIVGNGNIGKALSYLLRRKHEVAVYDRLLDPPFYIDASNYGQMVREFTCFDAVVSLCPHQRNWIIAHAARELDLAYFDASEDTRSRNLVRGIARGATTPFISHCGLAPGFVQIAAYDMFERFHPDRIKIWVGGLPRRPDNMLKYNLTWSEAGLVNEYTSPCEAIVDGELAAVPPMGDYEYPVGGVYEGLLCEAFNTSGGLGTLAETLRERIKNLDYKTLRYFGHHHLMTFLLEDLGLKNNPEELERLLHVALKPTKDDVVIVRIGAYLRNREVDQFEIILRATPEWTAMQLATASSIAAVVDMWASGQIPQVGFVKQEELNFDAYKANEYSEIFWQEKNR